MMDTTLRSFLLMTKYKGWTPKIKKMGMVLMRKISIFLRM